MNGRCLVGCEEQLHTPKKQHQGARVDDGLGQEPRVIAVGASRHQAEVHCANMKKNAITMRCGLSNWVVGPSGLRQS